MATYDTSYYDKAYEEFEKKQRESATQQKAQTEEDYNNRLKQAYISNRQTEKATNEALTQAGIRGGMTETAMLKNSLAYQNTRNTLGAEKASAIREIDTNADKNILSYKQTNDAAKNTYVENRGSEDRTMAREDAAEQKGTDIQYKTAHYGGITDIAALQKELATTTDSTTKTIIQARINYLTEENANKTATEQTAYWESTYGGMTNLDELKNALANASTTEEKTIIQNRINHLTEVNTENKKTTDLAYWESVYGGISDLNQLNAALAEATTTEEKTIIQNRINQVSGVNAENNIAYWESTYGGITNIDELKTALANATSTEEKTIIQNRINEVSEVNAENEKTTSTASWTAKYGGMTDLDELKAAFDAATTTEEKTIIQNRMNEVSKVNAENKKTTDLAYWENFYGGISDLNQLNAALAEATTTEEKTIILNRINQVGAVNSENNIAYWTAHYGGMTDISELEAAYANATTTEEKTIIQNRMNEVGEVNAENEKNNNIALWEAKYGGIDNTSTLKTALNNAPTVEEQIIILNRLNVVADEKEKQKIDLNTAYYSKIGDIDLLNKDLKKIEDPVIRTIIHARIAEIRAYKRGY